jgi:HK97 family phage major capsid protein
MTSTGRALRELPNRNGGRDYDYGISNSPPMPHHEARGEYRYSLCRAVSRIADGRQLDGLEGETSQEIARRAGPAHSFWMPVDAPMTPSREERALSTYSGGGAVTTLVRSFLDTLRQKVVLASLGARFADFAGGESGNVQIPTYVQPSVPSLNQEGAAPAPTNPTTSSILFTPHPLISFCKVTRRMLSVGTVDFQQQVESELARSIAVQIDLLAINGSGSGSGAASQPLGLCQDPRFASSLVPPNFGANGTTLKYDDLAAMELQLGVQYGEASADASVCWLSSPQGRSKLRRTPSLGSAQSGIPLWDGSPDQGEVVQGRRAAATSLVPANQTQGSGSNLTSVLLGNFADVYINLFGSLDILVNPYTQSTDGTVSITALQSFDMSVGHSGSFVRVDGVVTV